MKFKVCGLRDTGNIKDVAELGPDYIGLIRYERSPRYVNKLDSIGLDELPKGILKTGVFVNESEENILHLINKYQLTQFSYMAMKMPILQRHSKTKL